jgi:hypothetical protein
MPIVGESASHHGFREIRAWSRKELASTATITFGGTALGNSLLGPTLPVETSNYVC